MFNDTFILIFVLLLLVLFIGVFVVIARKLRRDGGSLTTTMHASTYEFLDKDKREAIEEVVEMKASKKMDDDKIKDGL